MKNKLLLVGGAGTLGSDLIPMLYPEYELFVLDNFSNSVMDAQEISEFAQVHEVDASDYPSLESIFKAIQPDFVIFLSTSLSENQKVAFISNVKAMENVIRIAEHTCMPFIIYIQSFLTRDSSGVIAEESKFDAKDSYSVWKLGAELLLSEYKGGHCTVILASVISPRLNVGAIPAFTKRILENKHIKVSNTFRDYLSPEDFTKLITKLLQFENPPRKLVVGSGLSVSTRDILEKVSKSLGVSIGSVSFEVVAPNSSDPINISLNSTLACKLLDVEFHSDIDKSIQKTVNNFIENSPVIRLHH